MAFNISYIYKAIDAFSPTADKIARSVSNVKDKIDKSHTSMKAFGESMRNTGAKMTGFITLPIAGMGVMALRSAAQLESMEVSFETLLGSAKKASDFMTTLKGFATTTPFELADIGGAARQLLVAGVTTEQMTDKMKMLGDIASGANIPLQDMSAIFAKMKNKGKAMAEELAQMSERGIPIMRVLSEGTGKTIPELYKAAEKGVISFSLVEKAMASMAGKGGLFFNSMEKQSKTLGGIWSNVQDAISFALGGIGAALVKTFNLKQVMNNFIKWMNDFAAAFIIWSAKHPTLTKWLFGFIALIAVLGPLLLILGTVAVGFTAMLGVFSFAAAGIIILAKSITFLTTLYAIFNAVLLISPLGWLLIGIMAVAAGIIYFKDEIGLLINKFKEWFTMKMPDWINKLIAFKARGTIFDFNSNQTATAEINNNNNNRTKVDVGISLEQLKGFTATTKTSIVGAAAGDLGTNMATQ